MSYRICS